MAMRGRAAAACLHVESWWCQHQGSITNEFVDELDLAKGKKAHALIKSTDVMIGR
jgi:ABC-type molybdate transport system ATPase subunit